MEKDNSQKLNIPDHIINEMAEEIECGMICVLNLDTMEIETLLGDGWFDPDEFNDEIEEKIEAWSNCLTIRPMDSTESYAVMERFIGQCVPDDSEDQNELFRIIDGRKPFANFKRVVEASKYRQQWFDFRHQQMTEYVKEQI